MRKRFSIVVMVVVSTLLMGMSATASGQNVIYSSIPQPMPSNLVSLGYQATSTAEFGDHIAFDGEARTLQSVTIAMSSWSLNSSFPDMRSDGYEHVLTLTLYEVDHSGDDPDIGNVFASVSETFLIPWRPEADPTCPSDGWRADDGECYNGLAFYVEFDLSGIQTPDEIIYGLAFNTQSHGYEPIGTVGPYNSLNFGLITDEPSVGQNVESDALFWNTKAVFGGDETFKRATGWGTYTPAIEFNVVAGPPTDKDQCKNGGWATFSNPEFKNQGQCVAFVASDGNAEGNEKGKGNKK